MNAIDAWMSCLRKRFYRTIEIEVSPEEFRFRYRDQERRVSTRGYLLKIEDDEWGYRFDGERETPEHVPIDLSAGVPVELHRDISKVLAAFLWYGMRPLCCRLIRPLLVFKGVERFDTGFGFEYAAFFAAGAEIGASDPKFTSG